MEEKIFVLVLVLVFSLTFISADTTSLSGGECKILKFPNEKPVNFEIISNTTSMENFSWNKTGNNIEYCFPLDSEPGNFKVRWFNQDAEVSKSSGGGSGGFFNPPKFTPEENEKEIDDTIIDEPEKEKEEDVDNKLIIWAIVAFFTMIILLIAYFILFGKTKNYRDERGFNEEEYE